MSSAGAYLSLPSAHLFSFPPKNAPDFIPPPAAGSSASAPPFDIPASVYQWWLEPIVPITIATVYAVSAKLLNKYNRSTNKRPWAISKTLPFKAFVILHNVFLAVYSAWTCYGMYGTLRRTMVSPFGPAGVAGTLDSMCRMSGPAGYGNGVFYDENTSTWQTYSPSVALSSDGQPLSTDVGRLWNEGLAFYGWIFYLSKFYEVLDTFIILAKGKFSSTLQTYHHAGAMMCMWSGIKYMSPPIWIFVFVNSGIHAMMYTYYTITALKIRVPMFIKRSLTSMQITQFLLGGSLAMVHSFVTYAVPVVVNATQKSTPSARVSAEGSPANSGGGSVEQVRDLVYTPCIATGAQTFGVWLNVVYLAPLTYLFMSFFVQSYIKRSAAAEQKKKDRRYSDLKETAEKAGWDAAKGVEREVYGSSNEQAVVDDAVQGHSIAGKRALRRRA
ncbi:fatty acid elongase-like protein [Coniochaeta sp. 2T2.1]|nr:fatty acid elongase-like protein [Coniochaeta sp. 2T2.1]